MKKKSKKPPIDRHMEAYRKTLPLLSYKEGTQFNLKIGETKGWEVHVSIPYGLTAYSELRETTDPFEIASHVLSIIIYLETEVARLMFMVDNQSLPKPT